MRWGSSKESYQLQERRPEMLCEGSPDRLEEVVAQRQVPGVEHGGVDGVEDVDVLSTGQFQDLHVGELSNYSSDHISGLRFTTHQALGKQAIVEKLRPTQVARKRAADLLHDIQRRQPVRLAHAHDDGL